MRLWILNWARLCVVLAFGATLEMRSATFSDALDSPGLTWTTGGDLPWTISTNSFVYGTNAAFSGLVTNGQTSWIETTIPGPATVIFNYRRTEPQSLIVLSNSQPATVTPVSLYIGDEKELPMRFYQLRLAAPSTAVRFQPVGTNSNPLSTRLDRVVVLPPGSAPQLIFENRSGPVLAETFRGISPYAYDNAGFGANSVTYHFFKDGAPSPGGASFNQFWPTNSGTYQVIASNTFGVTTSAPVVLTWVPNPPSISVLCCDQTVLAGAFTWVDVDPGASLQPLAIEWYRDEVAVPNSQSRRLHFTPTDLSGPHLYSVVLSNRYGTTVSSNLTVTTVPLLINLQPTNQSVLYGSYARFLVEAFSTQPLSYQWWINGTNLLGQTGSALWLSELLPSQSGGYSVVVSNIYGSITSAVAQLTVQLGPQVTISGNQTPWPKFPATFTVNTTPYSDLTFQWRLNNQDIPGATNRSHTVTNTIAADEGLYTCLVTGPYGSTLSPPASLSILTPPAPIVYFTAVDTNVTVGGTAVLFCYYDAPFPIPADVQWSKDGVDIQGETNQFLVIRNTRPSDAGLYKVFVRTDYGAAWVVTNVTVSVDLPLVPLNPTSQTIDLGTPAVFSVAASGSLPLRYQWFHNGTAIAGATNSGVIRHRTKTDDAGEYQVVVTNMFGATTSAVASLTLLQNPPQILSQSPVFLLSYPSPVLIQSDAKGAWPMQFQWFRDGRVVPGATNRFLDLRQATASDAGGYYLAASNAFGTDFALQATIQTSFSNAPIRLDLPSELTNAISFIERSNLIYVADGTQGLFVFEKDPSAPARTIGWLPTFGSIGEITLKESFALLVEKGPSDSSRLVVVDVSDPNFPRRISQIEATGALGPVGLFDDIAVVLTQSASNSSGVGPSRLMLINLGDPMHPKLIKTVEHLVAYGDKLAVSGSHAIPYTGNFFPPVFDLVDPFAPQLKGPFIDAPEYLALDGTNGAVLQQGRVSFVNMKDPSKPVRTGQIALEESSTLNGLAINGQVALATRWTSPHTLISVTNSATPTVIGSVSNSSFVISSQPTSGGFLCLETPNYWGGSSLSKITGIPSHPPSASAVRTVVASGGPSADIVLQGNRAYVAAFHEGVRVFDITNPYEPRHLGSWPDSPHLMEKLPLNIAANGTTAYVKDQLGRIDIMDFTSPLNPVRIGGLSMDDDPVSAYFGPSAYLRLGDRIITTSSSLLSVVNVSNAASPSITRTSFAMDPYGSFVAGPNEAYYVDLFGTLAKLHFDPDGTLISTPLAGMAPEALPQAIVGNHLYVALNGTLQVFQIGSATASHVGSVDTGTLDIARFAAEGTIGVAVNRKGEVLAFNLTNASSPALTGRLSLGKSTTFATVALRNGIAYLAAESSLVVVKIDGVAPTLIGSSPRITAGGVELKVHSMPGTTNLIESSPDLVQWLPVGSVLSTNRTTEVSIPASSSNPRFFRTRR